MVSQIFIDTILKFWKQYMSSNRVLLIVFLFLFLKKGGIFSGTGSFT